MCRYAGHNTHYHSEVAHLLHFKRHKWSFMHFVLTLLSLTFLLILFSVYLFFPLHHFITHLHYFTAAPLHCLPILLFLFIILWWESCCCFLGSAAASCSSDWGDHVSCCRGLCSAPAACLLAAAAPSVCDSLCCDSHDNGLCSSV